ncbi:MAG: hypothetical protein ACI37Z_08190 [Candidatus Gastranaerophilaceae bacterium]
MRRIVLIEDNALKKLSCSRAIILRIKDEFDATKSITSFHDVKEQSDISELIINQILASAISGIASTSICIISANNLISRTNIYSTHTIRFFVNKGKENGDVFLYIGNNKLSRLIARSWGFSQLKPLKEMY